MKTLPLTLGLALLLLNPGIPALAKTASGADKERVAKLVAVLNSSAGQKQKADACRELAQVGGKEAVAALAALLPDENLSHMARYGLEAIPDASVDKAFRDALTKLKGRQLAGVIGSIGVRRDAKAVGALAKLLKDPDPDVAQGAARALGSIGNRAAARELTSALNGASAANQLAMSEGLLRCAERLSGKQAVAIYDRLREGTFPHQVRTAAIRGAILARGRDGLKLLRESLLAQDAAGFAGALRAAQDMSGAEVGAVLVAAVDKVGVDRQVPLLQAISQRRERGTVQPLCVLAGRGDKAVRVAAIRGLAEIGDPAALPSLQAQLRDGDREIADAARAAFSGMPGKEADAAVLAMLRDGDKAQRLTAMELIARRRMSSALPELFRAASGADAEVRVVAIRQLGDLVGAEEFPRMLELLTAARSDADLEAVEGALGALCLRSGDAAGSAAKLQAAMAAAAIPQKCALVRILAAVGGQSALQAVRAAAKDSDKQLHDAAVRALTTWSTAEAAPDLLEMARTTSDPTERMLCLRGYLGFAAQTEGGAPKRLQMCQQVVGLLQKDDEKKLLLGTLGGIAAPGSLDLIAKYLDDPGCKEEACTAAVAVGEKLVQGRNADKTAAKVVGPMERAAQAASNPDLARRAQAVLAQARSLVKPAQ